MWTPCHLANEMTLQIGRALGRGVRRSASVSGVVVFVLALVYQVVLVGAVNTMLVNELPAGADPGAAATVGFSLPLSTAAAAGVAVASVLFGTAVVLLAARLLSRSPAALGTVPSSLVTRRFVPALLSLLVVNLVLAVAVPLGLVLFVVPGLFLAVSFQFAAFAVAVEDHGPLAALRRSWALARGERWRLLGLVVLLGVSGAVAQVVGTVAALVDPLASQAVSAAAFSVFLVVLYGVLADAYYQLRDAPTGDRGGGSGAVDVPAA
jgi:hypothetical protein